ncbi:hypothetical protein ONE63_006053 [Megalurothrips usitatus]|uniref:Large ribosomal subunit protein mL52 n=1 Tax=Megalurothrips usitatus TaxID=439358 RepID=A0AAV7XYL1_9NEOP|nr:hypothetical protein ONE63_006053 [Megalurothrips usitatus]
MMSRLWTKLFSPHRSFIGSLIPIRCNSKGPLPLDRWRVSVGLPAALNDVKEFKDYPDFSYVDGRPTPVTPYQLKEIKRQRALAASAVKHLKEIKYIEERHMKKIQSAEAERRLIIESKLKPKGDQLLEVKKV